MWQVSNKCKYNKLSWSWILSGYYPQCCRCLGCFVMLMFLCVFRCGVSLPFSRGPLFSVVRRGRSRVWGELGWGRDPWAAVDGVSLRHEQLCGRMAPRPERQVWLMKYHRKTFTFVFDQLRDEPNFIVTWNTILIKSEIIIIC